MVTTVENITPEQAALYLTTNLTNRKVRMGHVAHLTSLIKRGEWELTHQGICFDICGFLLDGQHRLMAIVASGKTVPVMITRGASSATYYSIDTGGAQRTATDVLGMSTFAASALRFVGKISGILPSRRVTMAQLSTTWEKYRIPLSAALDIVGKKHRVGTSRNSVLALCLCAYIKDGPKAMNFFRGIIEEDFVGAGDPTLAAWKVLNSGAGGASYIYREEEFYKLAHCYEAFMKGKDLKIVRVSKRHGEGMLKAFLAYTPPTSEN